MRLVLPALALLALPASAQETDREARSVVFEVDSVASGDRFEIVIGTDERGLEDGRRIVIRRTREGEVQQILEVQPPDPDQLADMMERIMESPVGAFLSRIDEGAAERMLGDQGASPETRARIRELEARAQAQAERTRDADGRDRRDAEAALDATLAELFEARTQARRERADALRDRAAALADEADEVEAALAERPLRRAELIEARRRALLDGSDG